MWPIIKKAVNSDLSTPLDELIDSKAEEIKQDINLIDSKIDSKAEEIKQDIKMYPIASPSDTLRVSADKESIVFIDETGQVATKVKEVILGMTGTIRVSYQYKSSGGGITSNKIKAQVYKNDVAVGLEQRTHDDTYITFTEDFTVKTGDKIQLYITPDDSQRPKDAYCRQFRIYWDEFDGGLVTMD
ncbi:MAG: hypothetical protein PHU69_08330 [Fermentimonas sp.]|nr:hypothetical protein [Fermentimonas sp.]